MDAKVYVGTYAKYNNGNLKGAWVALAGCEDYNAFLQKCKEIHKDERDPELMIQDCEDMPDGLACGESISEKDFIDIKQAMKEAEAEEEKERPTPSVRIVEYSEKAIAVVGDTREMKDELKKLGGTWNGHLKCGAGWIFSKKKQADVTSYLNGQSLPAGNMTIPVATMVAAKSSVSGIEEENRRDFLDLVKKHVKGDESYFKYFKNKTAAIVRLECGKLAYIDKPSINTAFCYAEGGQYGTMENALSCCDIAEKDQKHFRDSNMKDILSKINEVKSMKREGREVFLYFFETKNSGFGEIYSLTYYDIERNFFNLKNAVKLTPSDREQYLSALESVRDSFRKRIDTYLKRYGLSKVRAWTYYGDE